MTIETIEWQKQQAQKLFSHINITLDFDSLIVTLPNSHQLNKISNVTIKKFISYLLFKLNGQQGSEFEKGFFINGYIDEDDVITLLNTFYKIIDLTDRQVKQDLNLFYRYLSEVILQYEINIKSIDKLENELNIFKKDFKSQEELIYKVKKMDEEFKEKWVKAQRRWDEFKEEFEKILNIEKKEEVVKEKPIKM